MKIHGTFSPISQVLPSIKSYMIFRFKTEGNWYMLVAAAHPAAQSLVRLTLCCLYSSHHDPLATISPSICLLILFRHTTGRIFGRPPISSVARSRQDYLASTVRRSTAASAEGQVGVSSLGFLRLVFVGGALNQPLRKCRLAPTAAYQ